MVRIGVLTSSRADFGVYLPLLKSFKKENDINFEIIAFGAHLSKFHGYTINEIEKNGFKARYKISSLISDDSENSIASSAALTSLKFSDFWANHKEEFDIVLCLGDRFEMFSAVVAGVPYGIKFAHFYGGDYTKGVIDNIYRDGMTHCSKIHFTSSEQNAERVKRMVIDYEVIEVVGILSIEDLEQIELLSIEEFFEMWEINLSIPTILFTLHPETIYPENNIKFSQIIFEVLICLQKEFQLVITMPNADTNGTIYRDVYKRIKNKFCDNIYLVENFGLQSYFTCMKYAKIMIGNTSSGISEAASFNKYFINIGDRQKGRQTGNNVISVPFKKKVILNEIFKTIKLGEYIGDNIYKRDGVIQLIIDKLKAIKN